MKRGFGIVALLALGAVTVFTIVVALSRGVPSSKEREYVYGVGFSHAAITSRVGTVRDVSVALKKKEEVPIFAKRPQDWRRTVSSGLISGTVRLWILGASDGGFFTVRYTYLKDEDVFTVTRLDASDFDHPKEEPNSERSASQQPTPDVG